MNPTHDRRQRVERLSLAIYVQPTFDAIAAATAARSPTRWH